MKGTNRDVIQVTMTVLGPCEAQTETTYAYSTKLFGAEASVCVASGNEVLLSDSATHTTM